MSRRSDRKHAFVLIFQLPFHEEIVLEEAMEDYLNQLENKDFDKAFIQAEYQGTWRNLQEIDPYISEFSSGWALDRINKVDLAIMRLAVYEMIFDEKIPVSVSINEAVELAKAYGLDESSVFINGILGKIATRIREKNE